MWLILGISVAAAAIFQMIKLNEEYHDLKNNPYQDCNNLTNCSE